MIGDIIHISAINTTCSIDNNVPSLWRKEHYPNPQIDLGKCGRNCRKSWICDPSNIISVEQGQYDVCISYHWFLFVFVYIFCLFWFRVFSSCIDLWFVFLTSWYLSLFLVFNGCKFQLFNFSSYFFADILTPLFIIDVYAVHIDYIKKKKQIKNKISCWHADLQ